MYPVSLSFKLWSSIEQCAKHHHSIRTYECFLENSDFFPANIHELDRPIPLFPKTSTFYFGGFLLNTLDLGVLVTGD